MQATLHVETGEQVGYTFAVAPERTCVLGSAPTAQVRLSGAGVAPQHAALQLTAAGLQVVDLVGATLLDGRPLPLRTPAAVGQDCELTLGEVVLRVELVGDASDASGVSGAAAHAAAPRARPPLPPDEFDVVRELGRGGMGVVVQAVRRADGASVAVKALHGTILAGSPEHRRFVVEGRAGRGSPARTWCRSTTSWSGPARR